MNYVSMYVSVTTNESKTKIIKYQIHSHNPDSVKAEICHAIYAMKENIMSSFKVLFKVYKVKKMTKLTNKAACFMLNETNVKINLRIIRNNAYPIISSKLHVLKV